MNKQSITFSVFLLLLALTSCKKETVPPVEEEAPCVINSAYQPDIDPANFETNISVYNPYFPLEPGKTLFYEGVNDEGIVETVEVTITNQTKIILGVTCVVVRDVVKLNGEIIEDTDDWYAQDKVGNIWYFGEAVKDIDNGQVVSTAGSWEAGVDGALPGVKVPRNPFPGSVYYQEYYACEAEDMAQDISTTAMVIVPYGSFTDCFKGLEYTPLDPGVTENKYWAPGIGMVRSEHNDNNAYVELVDIQ